MEAFWRVYCCVLDVVGVNMRLKEGVRHVYLSEYLPFRTVSEYFVNSRQGMIIWDGVSI